MADPKLEQLEKELEAYRRRFAVEFYTIKDHLRDPNYPYTVSAGFISSGRANAAVIPVKKLGEGGTALP